MDQCYACDLMNGAVSLLGGRLTETTHWVVEHCMGPLGVGTLIVKPRRHLLHVWELDEAELAEMGPLLGEATRVIRALTECAQVYICLWSHGDYEPVHIHFVVQPVFAEMKAEFPQAGPALQVEMFRRQEALDRTEVEAFCKKARALFAS